MPKHRANGPRWPGMLHSSKDRAKPVPVDFVMDFSFRPKAVAALLGSRQRRRRNSMQPRSDPGRDRMAVALTNRRASVSALTHVSALKGEAAGAGRSGGLRL